MEAQIRNELITIYQQRYGDGWRQIRIKNLRPSPVNEIATRLGVSIGKVRKIKQQQLFSLRVFQTCEETQQEQAPVVLEQLGLPRI